MGTMVNVEYAEDGWHFELSDLGKKTTAMKTPIRGHERKDENGIPLYSEILYLSGNITSVEIAEIE